MSEPELKRSISLPLLVLYGLGVTIGAGIYVFLGVTARQAGIGCPRNGSSFVGLEAKNGSEVDRFSGQFDARERAGASTLPARAPRRYQVRAGSQEPHGAGEQRVVPVSYGDLGIGAADRDYYLSLSGKPARTRKPARGDEGRDGGPSDMIQINAHRILSIYLSDDASEWVANGCLDTQTAISHRDWNLRMSPE